MSPYVPVSGGRPLKVEIPEGEWLIRRMSPGNALFINLIIFIVVFMMIFSILLMFAIVLVEVLHIAVFLKTNFAYIILISVLLSVPIYLRFFPRIRSLTVSTRVSKGWDGTAVESSVYLALHKCGVVFREKRDDTDQYVGKVFFNRNVKVAIYVARDGRHTIIDMEGAAGKGDPSIFCLVKAISTNLGIGSDLVPIEDLLERQKELGGWQ